MYFARPLSINNTMKKPIISLLSLLLCFTTYAQQHQVDLGNTRQGENNEYCLSHKKRAELLNNPAAAASLAQDEVIRQQEAVNVEVSKSTIYYIPVVFHILHNNGIENISNDQVLDALNILNRDYRLQNTDANNVHSSFSGLPTDVQIEFRLATKAPDGTCFSGITRTVDPITNNGSNGGAQVSAIVNGNNVYQGQWPGDQYMNIFVCGDIGGAAGYTYRPSSWIGGVMGNGIWVKHNYVGSIGTSSTHSSRTLTHEAGHWLNLPHPWGSTNNPGLASNCSTDDSDSAPLITDTPNTIGSTSCNLAENTCGPLANVENYMDYSYCSKMFTQGQVNQMRNTLETSIAGRNNLITSANHAATGIDNPVLCKAEFSVNKTVICPGDQLTFTDESFNAVTGWSWTFQGGTPATSTDQNPVVTYNTSGIYEVTLTATDGTSSETETKTGFIKVLANTGALPFYEDFEGFSSLAGTIWSVDNPEGNGFELYTGTGHSGNKCVKLNNFGQPSERKDELLSSTVDLSSLSGSDPLTLSFRYSYKRKNTSNNEWLRVFISKNCGNTWSERKTIYGAGLSPDVLASAWTPSSQADWTTVHMTNISSSYRVNNFRYKFQFESDAGNNIYLDDINIYAETPSNDVVVGIDEVENFVSDVVAFPNPVENELNVRFSVKQADKVKMSIKNLAGQELQSSVIHAGAGSNLVLMNVNSLSQGMYLLVLNTEKAQKTIQFVIK